MDHSNDSILHFVACYRGVDWSDAKKDNLPPIRDNSTPLFELSVCIIVIVNCFQNYGDRNQVSIYGLFKLINHGSDSERFY